MGKANLLNFGVMILTPEDIKSHKQANNNKAISTISLKKSQKKEKNYSPSAQKEIIKYMLFYFRVGRFNNVMHRAF